MRQFLARWGSTLIYWTFAITAVTGVMLYFRVRATPTEELHIWIGFLMLAAFVFHVARNWRAFLTYFRKPQLYAALGLTAVVSAYFFLPLFTGGTAEAEGGPPNMRAMFGITETLSSATLAELAPVAHSDTTALTAKLASAGYVVTGADETVQAIAEAAGKQPTDVLATLLGGSGGAPN